jgi:hypothetical protein
VITASRRHLIALFALISLAAIVWFSMLRTRHRVDQDFQRRQSAFTEMNQAAEQSTLSTLSADPQPVIATLRQTSILTTEGTSVPDDVAVSLVESIARGLTLRYAHSPGAYVKWMNSSGHRMWRKEEMIPFGWDLDATAKHYLGDAVQGIGTGEAELPGIMAESDRRNRGASKITKISNRPDDWELSIKRVTPQDHSWPDLPGKIGRAVAAGATLCTVKTWWAVDSKFADAFEKHRGTYVAFVATSVECGDGKRRSLYWAYIYDQERAVWTCSNVAMVLDPKDGAQCTRFEF